MKKLKFLFIYILGVTLGILSLNVHANTNQNIVGSMIESSEESDKIGPWILIADQNNVKIYRSYSSCSGSIKVILKLQNSNDHNVKINFDSAFDLSGNTLKVDLPVELTVNANSTLGGDCSNSYSVDPYKYVTAIQAGVSDYIIQNLKVVEL